MVKGYVDALRIFGKPVVVRKKQSDGSWVDYMDFADVQKVGLRSDLVSAGVLQLGDAVAYFPPWTSLAVDDRIVCLDEFAVAEVEPKQFGAETVYVRALLKKTHQSVSAEFFGPDRLFFDDFGSNRESWTVKDGSWTVQDGRYVGEASAQGLAVAGDEDWENYVVESVVNVERGDAGLVCRFSELNSVERFIVVALRVGEGVLAVEAVRGAEFVRLKETEYDLSNGAEYKLRVHCFGGYLMVFLDGYWMLSISDLKLDSGKIGCFVQSGKASFDNVVVWGA